MFVDPVTLFREGGPIMYAILGLTSVLQLGVVVLFGSLLGRLRIPSVIWVVQGLLPLGVGLFGTFTGIGMALEAAAMVSPEMLSTLAAAGAGVALYTTIAGAYASAAMFVTYSVATGLGVLIRPGKPSRFTGANALIAVLVLLIGTLAGLVLAGPGTGFVMFGTGVGVVLGALRWPEEDERDQRRVAAARAATALYGVMALGCVAVGAACLAVSMAYEAQARASLEMRDSLVAAAMDGLPLTEGGIGVMALILFASTPFAVGPGMRVLDRRGWITLALSVLCVLPTLGIAGITGWRGLQLAQLAVPVETIRAEALSAAGVTVPEADGGLTWPMARGTYVTLGRKVLVDGKPAEPTAVAGASNVVIEAPGSLPLADLKPWVASIATEPFCLAVRAPDLRCVRVIPAKAPSGPLPVDGGDSVGIAPGVFLSPLRVQQTEDGWSVHWSDPHGGNGEAVREDALELRDLAIVLRDVRLDRGETALQVWLADDARVSDLVAFAMGVSERVQGDYDTFVVPDLQWRLDAPEALPAPLEPDEPIPTDPASAFEAAGRRVVRRYATQIRLCYERELAKRPDLAGEVEVQVSIGPDGRVINARVGRSTLANSQVEQCVVSQFLRMEFPPPPSGNVEVLRLPYVFGE